MDKIDERLLEKASEVYEEERALYVGNKVYYRNNHEAFKSAMEKAVNELDNQIKIAHIKKALEDLYWAVSEKDRLGYLKEECDKAQRVLKDIQ